MYYDRATWYAEQADGLQRSHYGMLAECGAVPYMSKSERSRFYRGLRIKQPKTYKPLTEAEAVAKLKDKKHGV